MKFQYYIKNVYGNETTYPIGEKFEDFVATYGQKTITPNISHALEILNIEVEEVMPPRKLKSTPQQDRDRRAGIICARGDCINPTNKKEHSDYCEEHTAWTDEK